jgi:hypothetical protein
VLDLHDRRLLLESLQPPEGCTFDAAIATTFTLDLLTLLTAPMAFCLFDWEDEEGRPVLDPVAVLEALRRTASRMTVFTQEGRIAVPARQHLLFSYLEDSVVEVRAPRPGGVFHPKTWCLRYTGDEQDIRYRVLCSSRNLTADRSWDTLLVLDGQLADRRQAFAANHPIADFVRALPGMATQAVSQAVKDRVEVFQDELRRVKFELPEGFDEYRFWPLGLTGPRRSPFNGSSRRRLIVSPFLSDAALEKLTEDGEDHILVSRLDQLSAIREETVRRFGRVFVLSPRAETADAEDESGSLAGLHAKLVIGDDGWNASVWTGSANATEAALNLNVEFLVELRGRRKDFGVEAAMEGLGPLLQEFVPGPTTKPDADAVALEKALDAARLGLMDAKLNLRATAAETSGSYDLMLERPEDATWPSFPESVVVRAWPITLPEDVKAAQLSWGATPLARFRGVALESLTVFVAFDVTARRAERSAATRFVLRLPLVGAPETRRDAVLRAVLRNPEQVRRLLMLLLADAEEPGQLGPNDGLGNGASWAWGAGGGAEPLLEALLRALHRDPKRLDRVDSLVRELASGSDTADVLPAGFHAIWEPIWAARSRIG